MFGNEKENEKEMKEFLKKLNKVEGEILKLKCDARGGKYTEIRGCVSTAIPQLVCIIKNKKYTVAEDGMSWIEKGKPESF